MRYIVILSLLCCIACEQPLPVKEPIPLTEDSTFLTGTFFLARRDSFLNGNLYNFLKDSGIQKIYLPSFSDADSLRKYVLVDTASYKADSTGEGLIYEITRRDDWGKCLLILGHGYSLPPAMKSLKAKPPLDSIGYADLFVVRKYRDSVKIKKFVYSNIPSISANATEK
jgi:hypothetical protein